MIAGVEKKKQIMESEATAVVKRSRSRVKDLQGLFSRGGRWFELRQKGFVNNITEGVKCILVLTEQDNIISIKTVFSFIQ